MIEDFTLLDLVEINQALRWRDRILQLETSTLRIRIDHMIAAGLEHEVNA